MSNGLVHKPNVERDPNPIIKDWPMPSNVIKIHLGEYTIHKLQSHEGEIDSVWIENSIGEGMGVAKHKINEIIDKYFKENF